MADEIKCGRNVFELKPGEQVLDNGACYQLISRRVKSGRWSTCAPRVSKKEFAKFKKNPRVTSRTEKSQFNTDLIIWEYK